MPAACRWPAMTHLARTGSSSPLPCWLYSNYSNCSRLGCYCFREEKMAKPPRPPSCRDARLAPGPGKAAIWGAISLCLMLFFFLTLAYALMR
jgi:hypothetical protein